MSELRDAIARMVDVNDPEGDLYDIETADAVLAMPELAAIRKALRLMAVKIADEFGGEWVDSLRSGDAYDLYTLVGEWSLPPSVVAWVLEGGEQ